MPSALPHFSLRTIASALPEMTLPDDAAHPSGPASMSFLMREYTVQLTSFIEGGLDLSVEVAGGLSTMTVAQSVPTFWNWSIDTTARVVCRDDLLLRPLRWEADFVCQLSSGPDEESRGSSRGWVHEGQVHHDGVDRSVVQLPEDTALSTSWSVLLALPRLAAAGADRVAFTLLEELVAVRPRQLLERIDPIDVPTASGVRRLHGWRQRGVGIVPLHFWTTPTGWPLLVCGQRRVLVATDLTSAPRPFGA